MAEHASVQGKKRTMWYERDNPEMTYPSGAGGFQNHHILPCKSVSRSLVEAAQTKDNVIKGVKYFSKWNINKKKNMKMLPTIPVYQKLYGKKGLKQGLISVPKALIGRLLGRPCHDRRHNVYNDNVKDKLLPVWAKVKVKLDKHDKISEATDIGGDLDTQIGVWAAKIRGRKTTQENWRAMCAGDEAALDQFAMAKAS
jgi:hypothetical protein